MTAAVPSLVQVTPKSWGIFSAAAMESGGAYMPWASKPKAHAQKVFDVVALWLNCSGAPRRGSAALHAAFRQAGRILCIRSSLCRVERPA